MKEWLRLDELANYLKISKASLYKMAQDREIPAAKLGRSWRFNRTTVDEWLEKSSPPSSEFPWQDCLNHFLEALKEEFEDRFASLWVYGSWARGQAQAESDVDLLIVMHPLKTGDSVRIRSLAYEATFGQGRSVLFSTQIVDQGTFLTSLEPLLLNVRKEGRRAA